MCKTLLSKRHKHSTFINLQYATQVTVEIEKPIDHSYLTLLVRIEVFDTSWYLNTATDFSGPKPVAGDSGIFLFLPKIPFLVSFECAAECVNTVHRITRKGHQFSWTYFHKWLNRRAYIGRHLTAQICLLPDFPWFFKLIVLYVLLYFHKAKPPSLVGPPNPHNLQATRRLFLSIDGSRARRQRTTSNTIWPNPNPGSHWRKALFKAKHILESKSSIWYYRLTNCLPRSVPFRTFFRGKRNPVYYTSPGRRER